MLLYTEYIFIYKCILFMTNYYVIHETKSLLITKKKKKLLFYL